MTGVKVFRLIREHMISSTQTMSSLFSLYQNRGKIEDILLEMDRILRPEGTIILRDEVDVHNNVRKIANRMRWDTKLMDHEDGLLGKKFSGDGVGGGNSTSPSSIEE